MPTEKVLNELKNSNWRDADVITFSGSGEPTLASNLGEVIRAIKKRTAKRILVLTNSSLLGSEEVRRELRAANTVFCKLDAWDEDDFSRVNHPHRKIDLVSLIEGIKNFRQEFRGKLGVQTMILKIPDAENLKNLLKFLKKFDPTKFTIKSSVTTDPEAI